MKLLQISISVFCLGFLSLAVQPALATTCQSGGKVFSESDIVWSKHHKAHLYCAGNDEWRYLAQWGLKNDNKLFYNSEIILGGGHITTAHENGALVFNSGPEGTSTLTGFWFRAAEELGQRDPYINLMRITADGNVGIGTIDPTTALEVRAKADYPPVKLVNGNDTPRVLFTNSAGSNNSTVGYLNGGIYLSAAGAGASEPHLFVMEGGNVGIGTVSPSSALEVVGDIRASNSFRLSSIGALADVTGLGNARLWAAENLEFGAGGSGGHMLTIMKNGNIDINNNRILRVAAPVDNTDAVNKLYADMLGGRTHCNDGQLLKWDGTSWECANDNMGFGNSGGSKICAGKTPIGEGWQRYNTLDVYLDVDTSHCGFTDTPVYTAAISGVTSMWHLNGESAIYHATPTGFRIYIQENDTNGTLDLLLPTGSGGWSVNWVAMEPGLSFGGGGSTSGSGWVNVPLTDTNAFEGQCMYRWTNDGASYLYAVQITPDYLLFDISTNSMNFGAINKETKGQWGYRKEGNAIDYTYVGDLSPTAKIEKNCSGGGSSGMSMVEGWPDAISCPRTDNGENIFYIVGNTGNQVVYSLAGATSPTNPTNWILYFNKTTKKFATSAGSSVGTYISGAGGHCLNTNTSIDDLKAAGRTHNFGGSGSSGGGSGGTASIEIGWRYWTWNSVDLNHHWYGPGTNFRNCTSVEYLQTTDTIQNTEVHNIILSHVLGADRTQWPSHAEHTRFLRDFELSPSYPAGHIHYGAWSKPKYGPSRLERCQVDAGTGSGTITLPTGGGGSEGSGGTTVAFEARSTSGQLQPGYNNFIVTQKIAETGGDNYNASTGIYTIPEAGYYQFNATINTGIVPSAGGYISIAVIKNGASICTQYVPDPSASNGRHASCSGSAYFAAGDQVNVLTVNSTASPISVSLANFSGFKVGANGGSGSGGGTEGGGNPLYMASGTFSFNHNTCGNSYSNPCVINISGGEFPSAPACSVTATNSDATSYTENMVIAGVTATQLKIWRGVYYNSGTTLQGHYVCSLGNGATGGGGSGGSGGSDNLGNHTATQNINLNGNWLSGDGGNEGIFVTANGNVGIGTDAPQSNLHIIGAENTGTNAALRIQTASADQIMLLDGNEISTMGTSAPGLYFQHESPQNVLMVFGGGNVGVGVTPTEKFHVAGNGLFTGTVTSGAIATGPIYNDHSSTAYDVWIQGGAASATGEARNLAILGVISGDYLSINHSSEYAGGTRIGGPVNIIGDTAISGAITSSAGVIRDSGGGWVRTYGATGWYNQTYNGGWYMADTTWVRSYSNKSVYTGGNMQAAAFLYASDARLKADIKPLELSLEALEGINAYRYYYKDDENKIPHIGVLAQEVQNVFPEAVKTGEDGMLSVDYPTLVPVLIDAVNILNKRIDKLEADNNNLREEIRALSRDGR